MPAPKSVRSVVRTSFLLAIVPALVAATVLSVACTSSQVGKSVEGAEASALLVVNAKLFGVAGDALLITGNRIAKVGPRADVEAAAPAGVTVLDAEGAQVLPGLTDAHIHMLGGGLSMVQVSFEGKQTLADSLAAVNEWAKAHPDEPWIRGRGWQYGIVPKGEFPTRKMLDQILADRPVFVRSYDGHAGWANSKALSLAGITAETADPSDGTIVREADGKTPSGALLENAMDLVWKVMPEPTAAEKRRGLLAALEHISALGVTSIDDIVADESILPIYAALEAEGLLPMRVQVTLPIETDLGKVARLRDQYRSELLRIGGVKGFVDGVIESKTAYMLTPYVGGDEVGKPLIPPPQLFEWTEQAHGLGLRVELHAIGDAGVRMSLDAFEKAAAAHPDIRLRHRIEHIEVVHRDDIPRFAKLGTIASMQPFHANPFGATPDEGVWSTNLGPERLGRSFAWRELLQGGATLAFGSDWPVMSGDPLQGIAVATTRRDEAGLPKDGWNIQQTVTPAQAVEAFSRGAAAAMQRNDLGSLEAGMLADLVVLEPGVSLDEPATLWSGKRVRTVVVDGKIRCCARHDAAHAGRSPQP